jgi:gamma-glutamyltranspeptidase / glutathione hydrolase
VSVTKGAVAAGHPLTVAAAEEILQEGGNAFDAIVAAHFCACVVEPVLASLAGGGYMLAQKSGADPLVYDFFVQTPRTKKLTDSPDFFPIHADFGTVSQEFHIGLGAIAVPGSVRGMFDIHRELCTLPISRLVEPAIKAAREGVQFSHLQAKIFDIVSPIYSATQEARQTYSSPVHPGSLVGEQELLKQPALADTLASLASEGDKLFYEGEIARKIEKLCVEGGGYLTTDDMRHYQVIRRKPLQLIYRHARLFTNPPPASGGILIAMALKLLEQQDLAAIGFGSYHHLDLLAAVMAATNQARLDMLLEGGRGQDGLLEGHYLNQYRQQVADHARCLRGTTHISVVDAAGNTAAMTVSNGEGCGHMVPGTGIMLNNMLGEEDINPEGFHCWPENQRMTSMMSPCLLQLENGNSVALGSGGSNRIRTAILQVVINLVDFGMSPEQAVSAPRLHYENGVLNIEPGFDVGEIEGLKGDYDNQQHWEQLNLYFGGVHTVEFDGSSFHGVGDPRRGGVGAVVTGGDR